MQQSEPPEDITPPWVGLLGVRDEPEASKLGHVLEQPPLGVAAEVGQLRGRAPHGQRVRPSQRVHERQGETLPGFEPVFAENHGRDAARRSHATNLARNCSARKPDEKASKSEARDRQGGASTNARSRSPLHDNTDGNRARRCLDIGTGVPHHRSVDDNTPTPTAQPRADLSALTDRLTPQFAAGLVKAQAAARNIENDRTNKDSGYKYATLPKILEGCRKALAAGGLALLRTGSTIEPVEPELPPPDRCPRPYGTMHVEYALMHESGASVVLRGQCDMYTNARYRTDKSSFGAMTMVSRYMYSGVLGIFWDDESADIDQLRDEDFEPPSPPPAPPAPPPTPPKPKAEPPPHPNGDYQAMLVACRLAMKDSPLRSDKLWWLATGLSEMPTVREIEVLRPHMLRAVRLCAENIPRIEGQNAAPERWTHESYVKTCEACELDFGMRDGSPTGVGMAADDLVSGEGPPADDEPSHDPETGEVAS